LSGIDVPNHARQEFVLSIYGPPGPCNVHTCRQASILRP
jgi:hypothetical protein